MCVCVCACVFSASRLGKCLFAGESAGELGLEFMVAIEKTSQLIDYFVADYWNFMSPTWTFYWWYKKHRQLLRLLSWDVKESQSPHKQHISKYHPTSLICPANYFNTVFLKFAYFALKILLTKILLNITNALLCKHWLLKNISNPKSLRNKMW